MADSSKLETIYSTKNHEFGIKTVELCESSTKYLLNFIVYAVANCDITNSTDVPDSLQHLKVIVKLAEPLVNQGFALSIVITIPQLHAVCLEMMGSMLQTHSI
jgi:hypothetical protein